VREKIGRGPKEEPVRREDSLGNKTTVSRSEEGENKKTGRIREGNRLQHTFGGSPRKKGRPRINKTPRGTLQGSSPQFTRIEERHLNAKDLREEKEQKLITANGKENKDVIRWTPRDCFSTCLQRLIRIRF